MRRLLYLVRATAVVVSATASPSLNAQSSGVDSTGIALLVKAVVLDSLNGGGRVPGQVVWAADSTSAAWLSRAVAQIVAVSTASSITCPGSTTAENVPMQPPVGYQISVRVAATPDSAGWMLSVSKACRFVFRGSDRRGAFAEWARWEIRCIDGAWRIVRTIEHWIT